MEKNFDVYRRNSNRLKILSCGTPGPMLTCFRNVNPLTIGRTVLKESDNLVILGVTFDSKMTFEKYLHSVSTASSQRRFLEEVLASVQR